MIPVGSKVSLKPRNESMKRGALSFDEKKTDRREWYVDMQAKAVAAAKVENKLVGDLVEEEWPSKKALRLKNESEFAEAVRRYEMDPTRYKRPKDPNAKEREEKKEEPAFVMKLAGFESTSLSAVQANLDIKAKQEAEIVYDIAEYKKSSTFDAHKWIIKLNKVSAEDDSKPLLLCFHGVGSNPNNFQRLALNMEKENVRVYGLNLPGRLHAFMDPQTGDLYNVVFSAIDALNELKLYSNSTSKSYKFILLGHCVGAMVAYELARSLSTKSNVELEYLIISSVRDPFSQTKNNKERFGTKYFTLSDREIINTCIKMEGIPEFMLKRRELMTIFCQQIRTDFKVLEKYIHFPDRQGAVALLNCPILVLGARNDKTIPKSEFQDWYKVSSGQFNESIFSDGGHSWIHCLAKLDILSEYLLNIYRKEDLILVEDD